jgi:uncharacterized protein (DUF885 family)
MKTVFAAAVVLAVCFAFAPSAMAGPSEDLAKVMKDYDEANLRLHPSAALYRGDTRYLDRYEDSLTPQYLAEARKLNQEERARLSAIDRAQLAYQDQLSYDIFAWTLKDDADGLALGESFQLLPLDQFYGAHEGFAREMEWRSQFPFKTAADYEKAITRMKGFAHWIDTAIGKMRGGIAKGVVQPHFMVERLIAQTDELANKALDDSVFMGPVKNMPENIKGKQRARVAAQYRKAVAEIVVPAYQRLDAFLKTEYLAKARYTVGLSAIPGGKEMYLYLVKSHTTTDLTPEEIHDIGLKDVARDLAEMEKVKKDTSFKGSLDEFRTFLRTDPRFKFKDTDAMKAEFERIKAQTAANIGRLFGHIPKTQFEIRPFEPFVAPSKASAEFSGASADGSRPGIFYFNTYDLPSRPTYTTEVLELHEAVPGHHFQISTAMENTSLPEFRRFSGPTAYVEGWGLYSESLGSDLGFYTDPYQKFGRLSFDIWRACRLVVDTGMHWMGWTREQAIDYMLANTSLTKTDVTAEVERYIAIPGQALAYKIGQRKLFELRDHAKEELGAKFDIRHFHDEILRDGAMPLSILETKMDRWIAAEKVGGSAPVAGKM